MIDLHDRFCDEPFSFFFVGHRGFVYLCCPGRLVNQISIGNVFIEKDINLIWNSENAKLIRKSVCDGSFKYCNRYCPKITSDSLPRVENCNEQWLELVRNPMKDLNYQPPKIQFAYDNECNLRCVSCRHTIIRANDLQIKKYDQVKDTILKPLLKNATTLIISGSGDIFASRHSVKYLEELNSEEYPKLRYHILTNGILFNEKNWERYPNMQKMTRMLIISVDAAKKETYENVRRGGKWEVLLQNLNFAGKLRKSKKIEALCIMFVVQKMNYQDMLEFIQLGYQIGADQINFSRIENWGIYTDQEFIDFDVCDPRNTDHHKFLEVIKHPFFGSRRVSLGNLTEFRVSASLVHDDKISITQ